MKTLIPPPDVEEARVSKLKRLIASCAILPAPRDAAPHPVTQLSAAPLQPGIPSHRCADAEERGQKCAHFKFAPSRLYNNCSPSASQCLKQTRKYQNHSLKRSFWRLPKLKFRQTHMSWKRNTPQWSDLEDSGGAGKVISLPLHLFASFPPPPLLHCSSGR